MDLEMQIAQEKLQFELYDALDASSQIADKVKKCLEHPDDFLLPLVQMHDGML